jgi:SWI/SNF-related matrix-associated actin-dependent regulator of chromatin subfamily A3
MLIVGHSLNLTAANRVFIVEPQWNPSVEKQAIARALRLGQGQSVLVTRYVTKSTVEQVRISGKWHASQC